METSSRVTKWTYFAIVIAVLTLVSCMSYMLLPKLPIHIAEQLGMFTSNVHQHMKTNEDLTIHTFNYINRTLHFKTKKIHTILLWNAPRWLNTDFKMSLCDYPNCEIVNDKNLVAESSAIMVYVVHMGDVKQPPVTRIERNPDQAWMFFALESPHHIHGMSTLNSPQWHDVFNWSWTYRQNSDIFCPYGSLVESTSITQRNYSNVFRKKRKMAAWLVSHCHATSKRDDYVKLLQKFIDVDIYGRCGKQAPNDILDRINDEYFFYLGFENSLCEDYVTEKFFKYYKLDVINVVRGDFNYNHHLPNGSFINTADFSSIKDLATFMLELSTNETAYSKYIQIKDKYSDVREPRFQDAFCNICEKLNNIDNNRKVYKDVSKWFGRCRKPTDLISE